MSNLQVRSVTWVTTYVRPICRYEVMIATIGDNLIAYYLKSVQNIISSGLINAGLKYSFILFSTA